MAHKCDKLWPPVALTYFTTATSILFCFFSLVGNGLVGLLVFIDPMKTLRTPVNYFILNLAFSDMVVACVTLPISSYLHYQEIMQNSLATNSMILHLAFFISITACCLSLIALTVDRYIAVKFPMLYRNNINMTRSYLISFMIWVISGLAPLMYIKLGYVTYLMVFANGALLLTLVVLMMLYVAVHRALNSHEKELVQDKNGTQSKRRVSICLEQRQKRVTRVFLVVIIVFVMCTAPAVFFIYTIQFCKSCPCLVIHVMRDLQLLFVLSTSAMNPFICTLRLPTFRASLNRLFSRIFLFVLPSRDGSSERDPSEPEPSDFDRSPRVRSRSGLTCAVIYSDKGGRLTADQSRRPSSDMTTVYEVHSL